MTKILKRDTHGHVQCYNTGCRCDECKQANTERLYKARKVREAKKLDPNDPRHGTVNLYSNFGCRCEPCTKANTEYCKPYSVKYCRDRGIGPVAPRHIPEGLDPNDARHGTANFYDKHGCRCRPCTDAQAEKRRKYQKNKKA